MKRIQVIPISPAVLKWARETRGFSIADVAEKLDKDVKEVELWEKGEQTPSLALLEKLAYQIYKRPLATFFLSAPPKEETITQDFRTLPTQDIDTLSPDFRMKVRRVKHHQLVLKEIFDGQNPIPIPLHNRFVFSTKTSPSEAAALVRKDLGISYEQIKGISSFDEALRYFKNAVEDKGIYIFQESLKDVSGFSLFDTEFPVICLNGSDISQKKNFTLFHELAHILFNAGGVFRDSLSERLIRDRDEIEIFCNQFAADFLVPNEFILSETIVNRGKNYSKEWDENDLERLAKYYKVSRETILRKLLTLNLTNQEFYQKMKRKWDAQYQKYAREKKMKQVGGPDFHTTNFSHLGRRYIGSVIQGLATGKITELDAASFLGIKVKKLSDYAQNLANYAGREA